MSQSSTDITQVSEQITSELKKEGYRDDEKISHVENLFIISYLTKALQDVLIRRIPFVQYPLLLIDFPLALAILIVNVERIVYVKMLGYVIAHVQFDLNVLKSLILHKEETDNSDWKERTFDSLRKFLRFLWGVVILLLVLPVWPLIWVYNYIIQTLLIATVYYFLMFWSFSFPGGFLVYYLLLATVTFLVASITVPFIFQISVYIKEMFSLEKKTWRQVHWEAKVAFLRFYQRLHGNYDDAVKTIKIRYPEDYKAEGGVYYMLLKFLHFLKDQFWALKEKKIDAVVETIQGKTEEFVDEYIQEKNAYTVTLNSISTKDLRRSVIALGLTIVFSVLLVLRGSAGHGIIGPILLSFVHQDVSETIWVDYHEERGYYEDMVVAYFFLPNVLKYVAMGVDSVFHYFFQAYFFLYPLYLDFLLRYYGLYFNFVLSGILSNVW